MSCRPCRPCCDPVTVIDPPVTVYRDFYHPQIVEVIHPVEIVNRHHCCPVRRDVYKYTCRDENVGPENNHHQNHRSRSGYGGDFGVSSRISKAKSSKPKTSKPKF